MSSILSTSTLFDVSGLIAVITGGGTGIGLMMAKALEHNGATVYIVGRRGEVLSKAAEENSRYGKIIPLQGDVTSKDSLKEVTSSIKARTGYINLLINNSGVFGPTTIDRPKDQTLKEFIDYFWNQSTVQDFTRIFEVNVAGVFYTTLAFLELLDAGNKEGRGLDGVSSQVITISSIGGLRRDKVVASFAYQPSKAAVTHMAKIFASILPQYNIRSNIIAPGFFPSEMTSAAFRMDEDTVVSADTVPLKRAGNTTDMGGLILYLASRAGAYINGNLTVIDGGRLSLASSTY